MTMPNVTQVGKQHRVWGATGLGLALGGGQPPQDLSEVATVYCTGAKTWVSF